MFLAALAQPRHNPDTGSMFNGLLGIWPFVTREPAVRSSKNRPRGSMVTKTIDSINRSVIVGMIKDNLMPAIREKFPSEYKSSQITIQQDNAKPHVKPDDPDVSAAGKNEGWNIVLKCQPPNSPDLNVLDLGYFASIQSIQYQCSPANIDELIQCVEEAYWSQPTVTTEKIFLSYQMAMESIMEVNGSNNYKLQHMSKDKLLRSDGGLPQVLPCSEEAVNAALEMLS